MTSCALLLRDLRETDSRFEYGIWSNQNLCFPGHGHSRINISLSPLRRESYFLIDRPEWLSVAPSGHQALSCWRPEEAEALRSVLFGSKRPGQGRLLGMAGPEGLWRRHQAWRPSGQSKKLLPTELSPTSMALNLPDAASTL